MSDRYLQYLEKFSEMDFDSFEKACEVCLDIVLQAIGIEEAFVSQVTSTKMYIIASKSKSNLESAIPVGGVELLEDTFCQYVRTLGKTVTISDAEQDERVNCLATQSKYDIKSYAGLPLKNRDGEFYGTLCVWGQYAREFPESEIRFLALMTKLLEKFLSCEEERAGGGTAGIEANLRALVHELRSPLANISGCRRALQQQLPKNSLDVFQANLLSMMENSENLIYRLIEDLSLHSLGSSEFNIVLSCLNGVTLLDQVAQICRESAEEKGLEFTWHASLPQQDLFFEGDKERTLQVLLNLTKNAIRYTEQGHVTLRLEKDHQNIIFRVEDSGCGIPAEKVEEIWKKGSRLSTKGKGLGLGLYISKCLCDRMGAKLELQSKWQQGSVFSLYLPAHGGSLAKKNS